MDDYAHIVDRSQYSKQTTDLFEVIAAYYTQLFYVHFYDEGKALKINGKVESITEGYRHVVKHFLTEYDKHDIFKRFLNDLCEYYIEMGFPHVLLTDFVHLMIREFLPADYFRGLSKHQCSVITYKILRSAVRDFASKLMTDYLGFVIDSRQDRDKPRVLQDEFIDQLLLQRHAMFSKITRIETRTERPSSFNHDLVRKMQNTIRRMLEQLQKSEAEIQRLKTLVVKLNKEKKEVEKRVAESRTRAPQLVLQPDSHPAHHAVDLLQQKPAPHHEVAHHKGHDEDEERVVDEEHERREEKPHDEIVLDTDDLYNIF